MKTYRELNWWSKRTIGLPIWATLLLFCVAEYGISLLGAR